MPKQSLCVDRVQNRACFILTKLYRSEVAAKAAQSKQGGGDIPNNLQERNSRPPASTTAAFIRMISSVAAPAGACLGKKLTRANSFQIWGFRVHEPDALRQAAGQTLASRHL